MLMDFLAMFHAAFIVNALGSSSHFAVGLGKHKLSIGDRFRKGSVFQRSRRDTTNSNCGKPGEAVRHQARINIVALYYNVFDFPHILFSRTIESIIKNRL